MKVVISGSRSIRCLPDEAKQRIDAIVSLGAKVLVGDAPGVDCLVQEYLVSQGYGDVLVYHAYAKPRNNVGNFKTVGSFDSYAIRDAAMCIVADYGLCIWDGKSKGSQANIERIRTRVVLV